MEKDELHKMFTYDDVNGGLYWKEAGRGRTVGRRFGMDQGYRKGYIKGKNYREHTLVWIYHYGPIPKGLEIDHINRVKSDSRIENLRLATRAQNRANSSIPTTNKTSIKGVHRAGNKYIAMFCNSYKSFDTLEEAALYYNELAFAKYGEFAYLNKI